MTGLLGQRRGRNEARRGRLAASKDVLADLVAVDRQAERAPDAHVVERLHPGIENVEIDRVCRVAEMIRTRVRERATPPVLQISSQLPVNISSI